MQMVIRDRRADEVELCVALLALVHKEDGYPANWPEDPAGWLTPRGIARTWIAVQGDRNVVGHVMVRLRSEEERVARVSRFFVSPLARGGGVGKRLLDQVIEWASEQGRELVLEVDSTSGAAIALYERLRWQRTGSYVADWAKPGGEPVTMLRYVRAA